VDRVGMEVRDEEREKNVWGDFNQVGGMIGR
jgi:hypothetical protein